MAIKVTLRQKKISKARKSLYLDFYPSIPNPKTGEPTRREFLGLYILEKPKTPLDKQSNKETQQLAEQIKQKRKNELNKPEIYTEYEKERLKAKEKGEQDFVEYFKKLARKRKSSNYDNWMSSVNYLVSFTNEKLNGSVLLFSDLNQSVVEEFRDYLLTTKSRKSDKVTLAQNSALSYFNKIKSALKQAYKEGILQFDLNAQIESIKEEDTQREYLTLEELNQLVKTDCKNPLLKQAALFSALTGLAFADIQKLTWSALEFVEGQGYFVKYRRKKTKRVDILPVPDQAIELLGKSGDPADFVIVGLNYSAYQNQLLAQWIKAAGIKKKITFHCFRHTYATLQLAKGTNIYTVSKMLGHKDLKTTAIYAKIVDQAKRDAAKRITLDL
ncbi:MAG: site-specific integrase [Reichenbachiella sp.]|uniref:site-specific integrase n=1 Tax=Reichenbachiella sp. TaxID=2184521 RepID=UPI00326352DA